MARSWILAATLLVAALALGLWLAAGPGTATSRALPAVDLAADEAFGGHTLERHVGRSDAELKRRLADEPSLAAASSFTDRGTAERAVAAALATERARVARWLDGRSRTNLVVGWRGDGRVLGRVLERGHDAPAPATAARVVLRRRGDAFFVLTAYPELAR